MMVLAVFSIATLLEPNRPCGLFDVDPKASSLESAFWVKAVMGTSVVGLRASDLLLAATAIMVSC